MKKYLLAALLLCFALPVHAETQIVRRDGDVVTQLPGNAQIVTNPNGGPRGVYIRNDDSIGERLLFGPSTRVYAPGGTYNNAAGNVCPGNLSVSDRNKCMRDLMKAQEKVRRKYND